MVLSEIKEVSPKKGSADDPILLADLKAAFARKYR